MKKLITAATILVAFIASTPAWAQPTAPGPDRSHPMAPVSADHVAEHFRMTEQMRVMGSDGRMVADPMWSEMRDAAHIAAEEHMHEAIDRMLAR